MITYEKAGWPLILGAAALAALTGAQLAASSARVAVVIPLAAAGLAVLAYLAVTRFALFVAAALAVRASLDLAKGTLDTRTVGGAAELPLWLDPGTLLGVLFLLAGTVWLAVQPRISVRPAIVFFFCVAALSAVGSSDPVTSAGETLRLAAWLLMIVVVACLVRQDRELVGPLLTAVFVAAIPPIALTLYQVVSGSDQAYVHGVLQPHGTFWHPNGLGLFSMLLLLMSLSVLPWSGSRLVMGVLLAGLAFTLVASEARTAWFGAVAGLIVVALLQDRRIWFVIGLAGAAAAVILPSSLGESRTEAGFAGNSVVWRFDHWQQALGLMERNPVTGTGLGTTKLLIVKEVHNDYLRAIVETGLLGLAAYAALLVTLALAAARALRTARAGIDRGVAVGLAACVAALAVAALADNVMTSVAVMWYLAAFAGLALGIGVRR
ncbi:O-antigen ligase family protein [Nonomuraea endophytica]|uniref:O-antigen ligase family protein n=1 Tax=Nonomuraea endophytica TaxID=714136 RepID=UPI0037C6CE77